jgi:hypothetical protein
MTPRTLQLLRQASLGLSSALLAILLISTARLLLPSVPPPPQAEVIRADDLHPPSNAMVVRIYPIADLMSQAAGFSKALENLAGPVPKPPPPNPNVTSQLAGPPPSSEEAISAQIIGILQSAIDPDNDPQTTISYWSARLVITTTPQKHDQVLATLRLLRQAIGDTRNDPASKGGR